MDRGEGIETRTIPETESPEVMRKDDFTEVAEDAETKIPRAGEILGGNVEAILGDRLEALARLEDKQATG